MKKPLSKKAKISLIVLAVILIIVLIIGIVVALKVKQYLGYIDYDTQQSATLIDIPIEQVTVPQEETASAPDTEKEEVVEQEDSINKIFTLDESKYYSDPNVENILLIGTDTRDPNSFAGNSDSMIIVSIKKDTKKILLTSVMRDTYVKYPTELTIGGRKVQYGKLNMAYLAGGGKFLISTIQANFRIKIDKYVVVNFTGFVDGIDILGGVDINLKKGEPYYINMYAREICNIMGKDINDHLIDESFTGNMHLSGVQALAYSRIRYIGNDFERTERQRKVLLSLFEKAKTSDLSTMDELLTKVLPLVRTDMSSKEILGHASNALSYLKYNVETLRLPIDGTYRELIIDRQSNVGIDFEPNYNKYVETLNK